MSVSTDDTTPAVSASEPEDGVMRVPVYHPENDTAAEADVPAAPAVAPEDVDPRLTPDPPRTEAERLDPPITGLVTLESGSEVEIQPLRLRETMGLLRIVTRGAGGYLGNLVGELNFEDPQAFAQTFGMIIFMALPEAEEEAVSFISAMCRPAGIDHLPPKDRVLHEQALRDELNNPSLDDLVTVLEVVIRRESEDIRSLGKRIGKAVKLGVKAGQLKNGPSSTAKG